MELSCLSISTIPPHPPSTFSFNPLLSSTACSLINATTIVGPPPILSSASSAPAKIVTASPKSLPMTLSTCANVVPISCNRPRTDASSSLNRISPSRNRACVNASACSFSRASSALASSRISSALAPEPAMSACRRRACVIQESSSGALARDTLRISFCFPSRQL